LAKGGGRKTRQGGLAGGGYKNPLVSKTRFRGRGKCEVERLISLRGEEDAQPPDGGRTEGKIPARNVPK